MLNLFVFWSFAHQQGLGNAKKLKRSCSLSSRIFDYEDGTEFIEPFCVLQGANRNPTKSGRNNVRITGGSWVAASKNLINAAAAGNSDFFAEAYIDEESVTWLLQMMLTSRWVSCLLSSQRLAERAALQQTCYRSISVEGGTATITVICLVHASWGA